jgi:hypothetical protein
MEVMKVLREKLCGEKVERTSRKKAVVFETMSFLVLAIAIIGVIIMLRVYLVGGAGRSFGLIVERHVEEGVRAGVNSVFYSTEERSGKTMLELIGISAYVGNDTVDFGPVIGKINVQKELEWRFDKIYGKGKWYLRAPNPDIKPDIQVVFVIDTSTSMCTKVDEMAKNLPFLIEDLRKTRKVTATIYLLLGGANCCIVGTHEDQGPIACSRFAEKEYLHCVGLTSSYCPGLGGGGQREEDWGNGIACAAKGGPKEGWADFSIRIGIPLSDEVPQGSECGGQNYCCASDANAYQVQHIALQNGINASVKNNLIVFPLMGDPCMTVCDLQSNSDVFMQTQCDCKDLVTQYMNEMASATGGKMFNLKDPKDVVDSIGKVISSVTPTRKPQLEAGTRPPTGVDLRSVTVPVPVSLAGVYTIAYIYEWS